MNRALRTGPADHAVVIGGSVAGALAARALSTAFGRVTVFDRDALPGSPAVRRGVPQSRHVHALLARGAQGLERLFPGFLDELTAAGAATGDVQADLVWYLDGRRLAGAESGLRTYGATRPLIEALIRERVGGLPNVALVDRAEVTGLVADGGRVGGVRVRRGAGGGEEAVPAALVVDAAGRGSRALHWLGELGAPLPEQTSVRTDVVYVTRPYAPDPGLLEGLFGALSASYPGRHRGGSVFRQENGSFAVLLSGMLGQDVPTDDAGMLAYAESLALEELVEFLRSAVPAGDASRMRYPESRIRHFARLDRHVEGFLVVGDALCNFNPVYGQGMTVAVMEAELLEILLEAGTSDMARRFFTGAAALLAEPWALATGGDLRFPEVEGERGPQAEETARYLDRFRAAAASDPALATTFLRATNLVAPLASLLAPEIRQRVESAAGV